MNMCLKNNYLSEPAIVISKPPALSSLPKKLCCASSAESLESKSSSPEALSQTRPTLLKLKRAFVESGSDIRAVVQDPKTGAALTKPSDSSLLPPPETPAAKVPSVDTEATSCPTQSFLAKEQNITFGQIEIAALSPLHIDSVVFEPGVYCSPAVSPDKGSFCAAAAAAAGSNHGSSLVGESEEEAEQVNCSRLIDALDIQSPAHFKLGRPSGLQSTPYKPGLELNHELGTPSRVGTTVSTVHENHESSPEIGTKVQNHQPLSPQKPRVADHIQHFNKLTLYSPRGSEAQQIRSPLRFQRTPVRQTVRRINSLLGERRRPTRHLELGASQSGQVVKAVSLQSGLSPHSKLQSHQGPSNSIRPIKKPPQVPPKKPSTLARKSMACALGDMTNKVQPKTKVDSDASGDQKPHVQQVAEDMHHYRGSPRNPLNQVRLLSATKPVDL